MDREVGKLIGIIFLIAVLVFVFGAIIYLSIQHPERRLDVGADIESVDIEDNYAYITLKGGSNDKELEEIKFVFTDNYGVKRYYSTTEGIENLSAPYNKSLLSLLKESEFTGFYKYNISAQSVRLEDFSRIYKIEVVFKYKKDALDAKINPPLDVIVVNESLVPSGGGGGGTFIPYIGLIPLPRSYWKYNTNEVTELTGFVYGNSLTLVLENSGLMAGTNAEFIIYEKDWFGDDYLDKVNINVGSNGYVSVNWIINETHVESAQNLFEGNRLELYFIVHGVESNVLKIDFYEEEEPEPEPEIPSEEADYYVAPWGDDGNNGSFDYPFFSLNKAWEVVEAGDLIYLRGGTYEFDEQQKINGVNGAAENFIKVWNYPGETPIFTKSDLITYSYPGAGGLIVFTGDYFHFKGIEITGNENLDHWVYPGLWVEHANHSIFELIDSHHNGAGFLLTGHSNENLILNSDFHHNLDPFTNYGNADGLQLAYIPYGNTNTVRGCRMWWNTDDGIDLWDNEGNVIIEDSWAWYNGYIPDTFTSAGDGNGFKLGKQDEDHGFEILRTITNCVASHNRLAGFMDNGALCNMELYNNIAYKNGETGGWAGGFHFDLVPGIPYYIKNNVAYDNIPTDIQFDVLTNVDHNSWDSKASVTDADFVNLDPIGLDGSRQADGSLPDITFGHLAPSSDLIDAGINVGLSYSGNAPDIGAFESSYLDYVYYISSSEGNDANDGNTTAAPWKTIAKVNGESFEPGNAILFKRGDTWHEGLVISSSGNSTAPITFSAYGTGNKPVFSGFTTLSSWMSVNENIYESPCPSCMSDLNMVIMDGVQKPIGRWPDSGWMTIDSAVGTTSISDSSLPASPDWDGAEVVIRKNRWIIDRNKIINHNGNTITYTSASNYPGVVGFGYFIQDDSKTLNLLGEWYHNPTSKNLQMYFASENPSNHIIMASNINTLVNINQKNYITFDGLSFEGANQAAFDVRISKHITIQNCNIDLSGTDAIKVSGSSDYITIENNTINQTNNKAISLVWTYSPYATIRNNTIQNTGMIAGMGVSGDGEYNAIEARGANTVIELNNIENTGYIPIFYGGSNTLVKNNFVRNFCMVKDDCGGIYTYNDASLGKRVIGNVVINSIGAGAGTNNPARSSGNGIYTDGGSSNVDIINNTVFNCTNEGFHFNNPVNVRVENNVVFNNTKQFGIQDFESLSPIRNLIVNKNVFFSKTSQSAISYNQQNLPYGTTIEQDIVAIGVFDNNYYYNQNEFPISITYTSNGTAYYHLPYTFEKWVHLGQDINSVVIPTIPSYTVNSLTNANKVNNSNFNNNISGWVNYGNDSSIFWDNNNMLDSGSLKVTYNLGWNYNSVYTVIGGVDSTKNYILRLSGLSELRDKTIGVYFAQHHTPYSRLIASQYFSISDTRSEKEILISYPTTDTIASLRFSLGEGNSNFYFDNVRLYEADVTKYNVDNDILFEYNPTLQDKVVTLDGSYIDVTGASYSGSVTIEPYRSIILIKD